MTMDTWEIAEALGASQVVELPRVPEGPLDTLALTQGLRERLQPGQGRRPDRPTNPNWTLRRQVPFSEETWARLEEVARAASTPERQVSPAQVAAEIIEHTLATSKG